MELLRREKEKQQAAKDHAGDDVKSVQANLGHATARFTLNLYCNVTQKMRQKSSDRTQWFYDQLYKK